jgi:hypothetical protein
MYRLFRPKFGPLAHSRALDPALRSRQPPRAPVQPRLRPAFPPQTCTYSPPANPNLFPQTFTLNATTPGARPSPRPPRPPAAHAALPRPGAGQRSPHKRVRAVTGSLGSLCRNMGALPVCGANSSCVHASHGAREGGRGPPPHAPGPRAPTPLRRGAGRPPERAATCARRRTPGALLTPFCASTRAGALLRLPRPAPPGNRHRGLCRPRTLPGTAAAAPHVVSGRGPPARPGRDVVSGGRADGLRRYSHGRVLGVGAAQPPVRLEPVLLLRGPGSGGAAGCAPLVVRPGRFACGQHRDAGDAVCTQRGERGEGGEGGAGATVQEPRCRSHAAPSRGTTPNPSPQPPLPRSSHWG